MKCLRQLTGREELAPFRARFGQFIDEWGFRCSGELMLTVPSFQERPAGSRPDAAGLCRCGRRVARRSGWAGKRQSGSWKRSASKRCCVGAGWRGICRGRERHSSSSDCSTGRSGRSSSASGLVSSRALLYSRCRQIVLAIGERLVRAGAFQQQSDGFFLTVQELDDLLSGQSMFPAQAAELVALRRAAHAQLSRQRPPDRFSIPAGEYWTSDDASC